MSQESNALAVDKLQLKLKNNKYVIVRDKDNSAYLR